MLLGKPDLSMILNGTLAGLVAITAGVRVGRASAARSIIGCIAGVLVVFAVLFFDKLKIDDPVGALSRAPRQRRVRHAVRRPLRRPTAACSSAAASPRR